MNYLIGLILSILSLGAAAGGWSSAGLLENVEIVRSQGFLMTGDLGDAAGCGKDGFLWIASDHPQYELLYSTALAAFMSGKRVHAYNNNRLRLSEATTVIGKEHYEIQFNHSYPIDSICIYVYQC